MLKTLLRAFSLRKTHNLIQRLDELCKRDPSHVFYRKVEHSRVQKCNWPLFNFIPILEFTYLDRSKGDRKVGLGLRDILPESGTSVGFYIFFICSMDCKSGDKPPCMHRILSSISAATGKQLKQSIKVFQSLILYRLLPIL